MFENTKKFCDLLIERGMPGIDLAVYKEGECVLRYINGYSDLENKVKMNGKERYNLYSCSKPITCTAALMLLEKGLYSLEDKLSDYMPEFSEMTVLKDGEKKIAENPILIKHLFEMTAGFSYECASYYLKKAMEETGGRCPTRETMKYLAKEPLLFEPGERWEYSLCHDVLAAFVEVISGEKFEDFVKKNIFDVLGMNDSTFMLPEEEIDTLAQQYGFENGKRVNIGKHIVPYKLGTEFASGGAGCISTVDDYIKFAEALRIHKLIKPETFNLMRENRLKETQRKAFWIGQSYGYGLGVRAYNGDKKAIDTGWNGAAGAYFALDMENSITIFLGTHVKASPAQGMRTMLYRFIRAELLDNSEFEDIYNSLKDLYDYNLTY